MSASSPPNSTRSDWVSTDSEKTLVLQSHRLPLPHPWLEPAMASVRDWAARQGFSYQFIDDALFAELTEKERVNCGKQSVVASDLARLRLCQRMLKEGASRVVWCDADTLIIDTEAPLINEAGAAFGRELWLQRKPVSAPISGKVGDLKLYKKIHNAFMHFTREDPVLDFYAYSAARLIDRHAEHSKGPMVAQLAGPKFLTHLHNVLQFDVLEGAQVLSPVLAEGLLDKDGAVLERYRQAWNTPPAALNLCASEVLRGSMSDAQMQSLIDLLLARGSQAFF